MPGFFDAFSPDGSNPTTNPEQTANQANTFDKEVEIKWLMGELEKIAKKLKQDHNFNCKAADNTITTYFRNKEDFTDITFCKNTFYKFYKENGYTKLTIWDFARGKLGTKDLTTTIELRQDGFYRTCLQ